MYNKTIIRFGFCDILNNQGLGECYHPRPSARLITLTSTLKKKSQKTSSNNCLLSAGAVMLLLRLEYKTNVICHNVNTKNLKFARRDRPHILASHRCEAFENSLHIVIAQWREFFQGFYTQKMIFISINIHSFYVADKVRFSTGKMCKLSRTLYKGQLIQFARIPLVRFLRYQNCVKVIRFSMAA